MEVKTLTQFGKPGILNRFVQLDDDLYSIVSDDKRIEITIVGGSALVMLDLVGDARVTTDIDVMDADLLIEHFLARYDMNQYVDTFRFRLPDNWLKRRQKIPFEGAVLDVYAPSNEDLAIMKLDAYREVDQIDLREMVVCRTLDISRLEGIISNDAELRVNYDESEWDAFLHRFNELKSFAASLEVKE